MTPLYKNGISKNCKFFGTTSNENSERFPLKDLPKFVPTKWIDVYDQSEEITMLTKKLESKHQC